MKDTSDKTCYCKNRSIPNMYVHSLDTNAWDRVKPKKPWRKFLSLLL